MICRLPGKRADERTEALGADIRDWSNKFSKEGKIGWRIENKMMTAGESN